MNAYTMCNAGAVIHTHSKNAVMVTLLYPGTEFRITHQEMIKGIKRSNNSKMNKNKLLIIFRFLYLIPLSFLFYKDVSYQYDDELIVPIIENKPFEEDLKVVQQLYQLKSREF